MYYNECNWKITIVLIFILVFSACENTLNYYTTKEPNRNNIVGIWVPDKSTLIDMNRRGNYASKASTRLILGHDGGLELIDIPDWWDDKTGTSRRTTVSYTGSWTIFNNQGFWVVGLKYSDKFIMVDILKNAPPHKLELILGDPDSGNRMIFIRQNTGK